MMYYRTQCLTLCCLGWRQGWWQYGYGKCWLADIDKVGSGQWRPGHGETFFHLFLGDGGVRVSWPSIWLQLWKCRLLSSWCPSSKLSTATKNAHSEYLYVREGSQYNSGSQCWPRCTWVACRGRSLRWSSSPPCPRSLPCCSPWCGTSPRLHIASHD